MIKLTTAGVSAFTWQSTEQVWPFEKAADGSTLYAKEVDLGTLPNNGTAAAAHGIPNFLGSKIKRMHMRAYMPAGNAFIPLPFGYWGGDIAYDYYVGAGATTVYFGCTSNYTGYRGAVTLIYTH